MQKIEPGSFFVPCYARFPIIHLVIVLDMLVQVPRVFSVEVLRIT